MASPLTEILTPADTNVAARLLTDVEQLLGGRIQLMQAIGFADEQDEYAQFIGALADPRNDRIPLGTLCADYKIRVPDFIKVFRRGTMLRAVVQSILLIAERTPVIVEEVLARAVTHEDDCPECQGRGEIQKYVGDPPLMVTLPCLHCAGNKRVTVKPELATQKFALETLAGYATKTPLIQQNIDNSRTLTMLDTSAEGRAQLLTAVDKLLRSAQAAPLPTLPAASEPEAPTLIEAP